MNWINRMPLAIRWCEMALRKAQLLPEVTLLNFFAHREKLIRPSFLTFGFIWWAYSQKYIISHSIGEIKSIIFKMTFSSFPRFFSPLLVPRLSFSHSSVQRWDNEHIWWDPNEFCGLDHILVPTKFLWMPDLTIEEM